MLTMKQFIAKCKINVSSEYADNNPNMPDARNMNHYKVRLKCGGRQMTLYFSQGYGITKEPDAASVLSCLSSESAEIENASGSFEDWANEYGYDTDSRKAERMFKACKRQAEKLKKWLGEERYKELLREVEPI